jgi:hypothetical protein
MMHEAHCLSCCRGCCAAHGQGRQCLPEASTHCVLFSDQDTLLCLHIPPHAEDDAGVLPSEIEADLAAGPAAAGHHYLHQQPAGNLLSLCNFQQAAFCWCLLSSLVCACCQRCAFLHVLGML